MKMQPCHHCNGSGQEIDSRRLGQDLRNKRISRKISLRDLSERMGICAPYLCELELGRRRWSNGLIERFEKALEA
jgi:transcriptional regulator with XRE-family HTH domain